MKYMGGKNRLSKYILPIMLSHRVDDTQVWVEPFVGGANIIDKVSGLRIGSDNNKYLISMWQGLQQGLDRPYIIDRDYYSLVRSSFNTGDNSYSDFIKGWVGFMGSYNGRFFDGGYSGHNVGKTNRDYIGEAIRNIESQLESILGIDFYHCNYTELVIPDCSLIYCDIPYKGTKQYGTSKNFDHVKFWQWARDMKSLGHTVFVSEYNAPDDIECIWEMERKSTIHHSKTIVSNEKLYKV